MSEPHMSIASLRLTIGCPACGKPVRAHKNRVQHHITPGGTPCKWVGQPWRTAINTRRLMDSEPKLVKEKS